FGEDQAADVVVLEAGVGRPETMAVLLDAVPHRLLGFHAVLGFERGPRHADWQQREVDEETDARDGLVRSLEPEEKRLARCERLEIGRPWPPEVHLVQIRALQQESVPIVVGVRNVRAHGRRDHKRRWTQASTLEQDLPIRGEETSVGGRRRAGLSTCWTKSSRGQDQ